MKFDVVLVGDFRVPGGTSRQASNAIAALHSAGHSVGLVGVQLPHARGPKPLDPLVRERIFLGEAKVISPARHSTIEAGLVIFENPRAFLEPPEVFFRIETTRALMTVHFPLRDGKSRPTFDPERVLEVCRGITGAEVVWAPVSPLVRRLLLEGACSLPLTELDLPNIVSECECLRENPIGTVPVIGRHSRPEKDKWPATRSDFLEVYPDTPEISVRMLGVGQHVMRMFRRPPGNWKMFGYGEIAPADLLRSIDFFVYYHHPSWVEAFGIATAEALASGAVAVLPEYMRENFRDAALYSPRERALDLVRELYSDWDHYREQSELGRRFVAANHSADAYLKALSAFLPTPGQRSRRSPIKKRRRFDVLVLADMAQSGEGALRFIEEITIQADAGMTTGLVHCRSKSGQGRIRSDIRTCLTENLAQVVEADEKEVEADLLVIHSPGNILDNLAELNASWKARRILAVVSHAFTSASRLPSIDAVLKRYFAGDVIWAPTNPLVRVWLEGCDSVRIYPRDWKPVLHDVAAAPRSLPGRTRRIGFVASRNAARWQKSVPSLAAQHRKLEQAELYVYGVPQLQGGVAEKLGQSVELFGRSEVSYRKFLLKIDVLLARQTAQDGEGHDMAIAAAMARGIPVILPERYRASFPAGATYADQHGWLSAAERLLSSPRRFAAASRSALEAARRLHGPDEHLSRLAELTGKSRPLSRDRPKSAARRTRVLMLSQNGVGLGHVVRQLAIARYLNAENEPIFLSMSQAIKLVADSGFQTEFLPSHVYLGANYEDWHAWTREHLDQVVDFYGIGAVVLDGNTPYRGVLDSIAIRDDVKLIWIRRAFWPTSPTDVHRVRLQRFFDLVIEPADIAEEVDTGPTVPYRDRVTRVEPISLLKDGEVLDRREACRELGLDPRNVNCLVQLGSGTNRDIVGLITQIVEASRAHSRLRLVLAEWFNATETLDLWPQVPRLVAFPLARYYRAFDFSIAAAGYNTFHEVVRFGLPTVFIANPRGYMDNQVARASFLLSHGAALTTGPDPREMVFALAALMQGSIRSRIRKGLRRFGCGNGAAPAAKAIAAVLRQ